MGEEDVWDGRIVMGSDSVQDKVNNWLREEGYSLEMQVARVFCEKKFDVLQSDYYVDQDTGEQRELDVWASRKAPPLSIGVCVECKSTKGKPWVVFRGASVPTGFMPWSGYATSPLARIFLGIVGGRQDARKTLVCHPPACVGYSLRPAFKGPDNAYEAVFQAVKGAAAKAPPTSGMAAIGIPAIVIDGRLYEAFLDDDGNPQTEEVACSAVLWRQKLAGVVQPLIHVVTLKGLSALVDELDIGIRFLLSMCSQDLEQAKARELRVRQRQGRRISFTEPDR